MVSKGVSDHKNSTKLRDIYNLSDTSGPESPSGLDDDEDIMDMGMANRLNRSQQRKPIVGDADGGDGDSDSSGSSSDDGIIVEPSHPEPSPKTKETILFVDLTGDLEEKESPRTVSEVGSIPIAEPAAADGDRHRDGDDKLKLIKSVAVSNEAVCSELIETRQSMDFIDMTAQSDAPMDGSSKRVPGHDGTIHLSCSNETKVLKCFSSSDDDEEEDNAEEYVDLFQSVSDLDEDEDVTIPKTPSRSTRNGDDEQGDDGIDVGVSVKHVLSAAQKSSKNTPLRSAGPRYFCPVDVTIKCFHCGEVGHRRDECTGEKKKSPCFLCGSLQHNAPECTVNSGM